MAAWESSAGGQFTTDRDLVVQTWDAWMAAATGIEESTACGQRLDALFPDLLERGLLNRIARVAEGRGVEVLAPALHKYLVPCAPLDASSRFEHMRQHVTIAPLLLDDAPAGVSITIKDVTARFDQTSRLAADLDSDDQQVRLVAAEALGAQRASPMLLAGALSDSSWRVRRAAAAGLARTGGAEVQETLVEALRDNHRNLALLNSALTSLAQSRDDLTARIVELLDQEDADTRTYAALALGLMGDPRAVPPLLARLREDDQNVQFHVIEALGRIGDRRAVEPLAGIAESRDFFLGFAALDALASIGDASIARRLVPLLDDDMLGAAAVACLAAIGQEDVAAPLAQALRASAVDVKALAAALAAMYDRLEKENGSGNMVVQTVRSAISAHDAERLIAALPQATDDDARAVAQVIAWLSFEQVDPVLASLLARPALRGFVGELFAERGIRSASAIVDVASGTDHDVRKAAARILGRIGSPGVVPALLAWMRDASDADSLMTIVGALAAIGDRRAFEPLLALMDHPEATVRQVTVSALNSIGHADTERAMRDRLSDPSPRVRECAVRVTCNFAYPSLQTATIALSGDADDVVRRAAVEALGSFESDAAAETVHRVVAHDADAAVRAAAARALGHWESDASLRALLQAMQDENLWVRYYAVRALGRRGESGNTVVEALTALAEHDPVTPVRLAAIETLGSLRAPGTVDTLVRLARASEVEVAIAAIAAMGHADTKATANVLLNALESSDETMQAAAIRALAAQRASHAVARIVSIARSRATAELRAQAVHALGQIQDEAAIRALVELTADLSVRKHAMKELSALPAERSDALVAAAQSAPASMRELAVEAMGWMHDGKVAHAMAAFLSDPDPRVRVATERALARFDAQAG